MAKVIITIKDSTKNLFDFEIKGLEEESGKLLQSLPDMPPPAI